MRLILLFLLTAKVAIAQVPVNSDSVRILYPELLQRFKVADTTLTRDHLKILYYGFPVFPSYDPEVFIPIENRIRDFNSFGKPEHAIQLADSLLELYPVSLVAHFEKAFALNILGKKEEERTTSMKYKALIRTIIGSGDGRTPETAYIIINPNDEFDLIRYLNLTAAAYTELNYNGRIYDVLEMKRNKQKIDKLFFDITLSAKLKEKKQVERLRDK